MFRKILTASVIAAAIAAAATGSAGSAAANTTVCLYNESRYPTTLEVRGNAYRDSRGRNRRHIFRGVVAPYSAGCCPPSHPACRGRLPYVSLYWNKDKHPNLAKRWKPKMVRLKLRWLRGLRNVRVPLPINPRMGPNLLRFCNKASFRTRRNARIRLHTSAKGRWVSSTCEVFTGRTALKVYGHRNMTRRTHFFVCNDTRQPAIYVAYSYFARRPRGWTARGYHKIPRGQCRQLWLPSAYYRADVYFYATGGKRRWAGRAAHFCIHPTKAFKKAFADKRCPAGYRKAGFHKRRIGAGSNAVRFTER